jgi:hypothetical protein
MLEVDEHIVEQLKSTLCAPLSDTVQRKDDEENSKEAHCGRTISRRPRDEAVCDGECDHDTIISKVACHAPFVNLAS